MIWNYLSITETELAKQRFLDMFNKSKMILCCANIQILFTYGKKHTVDFYNRIE